MRIRKRIEERRFTAPRINALLRELLQNKSRFWRAVAEKLSKPRRSRVVVNVSKINRIAKDGEKIVVPGKVLGAGVINKKVDVICYECSQKAKEKIEKAGGKVVPIEEMLKKNPEGKGLKIVM